MFRGIRDVMWKPFCVWFVFLYICSIRSVLVIRNGISIVWYTFLYDFLIYLVDYVNSKFVCDGLFLLYSVWACFMTADLVLDLEKPELFLLISILYLLITYVLGQIV